MIDQQKIIEAIQANLFAPADCATKYNIAAALGISTDAVKFEDDAILILDETASRRFGITVTGVPAEIVPRNRDAIEQAVVVLNEAFKADPVALWLLIANRVQCNEALAAHPWVQVRQHESPVKGVATVGLIGVLNGVLEPLTGYRVAAKFSETTNVMLGFGVFDPVVEIKAQT